MDIVALKKHSLFDFRLNKKENQNKEELILSVKRTNGSIMACHGWQHSETTVNEIIEELTEEML